MHFREGPSFEFKSYSLYSRGGIWRRGPAAIASRLQELNQHGTTEGSGWLLSSVSSLLEVTASDRAFLGRDVAGAGPGTGSSGVTAWYRDLSLALTAHVALRSGRAAGPQPRCKNWTQPQTGRAKPTAGRSGSDLDAPWRLSLQQARVQVVYVQ